MKTGASTKNKLIWLLESIVIATALFIKIEVMPDDGSELPVLVNLAKLRESFAPMNGAELFVALAAFCTLNWLKDKTCRDWRITVLAGIFAVLYVTCRSFKELGASSFLLANTYQRVLSAFCILGYLLLFRLVLNSVFYLAQQTEVKCDSHLNSKRLWSVSAAVIFLCYLPWLFASYPASFCPDCTWQLEQFFGLKVWSTHHPPLSTAIMGICVSVGEALKDRTFGCFIYVFFQTVLGAAIFSFTLVQMRKMGCGKKGYIIALLFYALAPVWGVYAQWFEKDLLYAELFILDLTLITDVVWKRSCTGKQAISIAAASVAACLLRNNGKYEIIPLLLCLIFIMKKDDRKRIILSVLASVTVFFSVTGILYPSLGIEKGSVKEALSIPFQQTAGYVVNCGDEVTDYEREVIDSVLDYSSLSENYSPTCSDSVKNTYRGDNSKLGEYFKVWLSMGIKHPAVYLDAFIHQSYGYLAPVEVYGEPCSIPYSGDEYSKLEGLDIYRQTSLIPTVVFDLIWSISTRLPLIRLLFVSGSYVWMSICCVLFVCIKKKYHAVLPFIPLLMNALMCIASPQHATIRYILPSVAAAPLIMWWTVMNVSRSTPHDTFNVCIENEHNTQNVIKSP